jgi:hypothetical protein
MRLRLQRAGCRAPAGRRKEVERKRAGEPYEILAPRHPRKVPRKLVHRTERVHRAGAGHVDRLLGFVLRQTSRNSSVKLANPAGHGFFTNRFVQHWRLLRQALAIDRGEQKLRVGGEPLQQDKPRG